MLLSFVFPVHNEGNIIIFQIEKFISSINQKYKKNFEIILIENGSVDNSWFLIKKLEKKYPFIKSYKLPYPTYGGALRRGLMSAVGRKIFFLNVDYFNFDFICRAIRLLNTVDVVIGSKTLASSEDRRPFLRRYATYFFNVFLRFILNYPGTDTHGIKAFRRSKELIATAKICRSQNELFDTELILRLTRHGAIFVDLPQNVSEIRPTRYAISRRLRATFVDFFSIIKTKYFFGKNFFPLLVDADDFGMSNKINLEILNEAESGGLDIVSIMPNLVKLRDIKKLKKIDNLIDYSMHFNLLRGKPCSPAGKVGSLINVHGNFYSLPIFVFRLFFGLIDFEEIKTEFFAQYKSLLDMGIEANYLNSEQHTHVLSPIGLILEKNISKTKIKKIRSVESSVHSLDRKYFRRVCLVILRNIFNYRFSRFVDFKKKYDAYIVHLGL